MERCFYTISSYNYSARIWTQISSNSFCCSSITSSSSSTNCTARSAKPRSTITLARGALPTADSAGPWLASFESSCGTGSEHGEEGLELRLHLEVQLRLIAPLAQEGIELPRLHPGRGGGQHVHLDGARRVQSGEEADAGCIEDLAARERRSTIELYAVDGRELGGDHGEVPLKPEVERLLLVGLLEAHEQALTGEALLLTGHLGFSALGALLSQVQQPIHALDQRFSVLDVHHDRHVRVPVSSGLREHDRK